MQANAVVSGAGHQGDRRPGAWLLSHDSPCLRARTKQWLLELPADDPSVEADRREYRRDPVLARLLAAQAPDGSWNGPALYCPKHRSTFWTLAVLAEMGVGRGLALPAEARALRDGAPNVMACRTGLFRG